jgi:hypothetical protein
MTEVGVSYRASIINKLVSTLATKKTNIEQTHTYKKISPIPSPISHPLSFRLIRHSLVVFITSKLSSNLPYITMSNTSERAKKAALTRAHRQALQALSDKKLIASASGKYFSYAEWAPR